jgi:tRNA (cytidine/uridine-2'-O-)-methyltransferase
MKVANNFETTAPDIAFFEPRIPGNTGAAIRLTAVTGSILHLIEPLGFDMTEAKLKRAGLDYHDLAHVVMHKNFDEFVGYVKPTENDVRIIAFTTTATRAYNSVEYNSKDVLLFGPEPDGLPRDVIDDERVDFDVRIPMRTGLRSLNLANSASIALYEAWRQGDFVGGV